MKKRLVCWLLCVCAACFGAPFFALGAGAAAKGVTLYVSPAGDDAAAGTRQAPLKTPAGAQKRLREMKKTLPENTPVTVEFAGGRYEFAETLVFTAEDLPNVTFRAKKGEEVTFSGARELSGFAEAQVNGVRAFKKELSAAEADFGTLLNGETQLSAPRWPAEGYFNVKDTCPADDLWTEEDRPWEFTLGQRSFYGDPADLSLALSQPQSVRVRILHWWHDELAYLTGYAPESGKLSLSRPSSMLIRPGDRYYFENVFEMLQKPGQWYLDQTQNVLWYVPQAGETPETLTLRAAFLERLVEIDGVSGLAFEGIRFAETDWRVPTPGEGLGDWRMENDIDALQAALDVKGVVTVRHAENVSFTNCEFLNLGADAVKLAEGVRHSRVENCYFENIAATAVFVGGANCLPGDPELTADITVRNNEINGYGRRFFCAIGVHVTFCDTAAIENNEIHDGFYTAVSCGWVWGYGCHATKNISIKNNLIYDIGQGWLSDMGGIYMLGVQPGTVLSGNVIHNVAADPGEGGYGGWGIYLDEGSSFITVERNLVFCCGSQGLNIHYGEGNVFRNNISALSAEGQVSPGSRGEETHATAFYYNNIFVTSGEAPVYVYMKHTGHFYENGNLFWNASAPGKLNFAVNGTDDFISLAEARREGFIHNETAADPLFKDLAHFDFALAEDSPALQMNFIPWDYAEAGTLPGSTLGRGRPGGTTPYAQNARLNPEVSFGGAKNAGGVLKACAAALGALSLVAALVSALRHAPGKTVKTLLILLFCGVSAAVTYRVFIDWQPALYAMSSAAMYVCGALLPLPGEHKERGRAVKGYFIRLAAVLVTGYGLTLLTNNALRLGESVAIGIVLTAFAAYLLAGTVLTLKNEK